MASPGRLICIVGPTASGKTELALKLAELLDGEIICADSRTVYRQMDIGTAKPTAAERSRVTHHLLDLVSPDQPFTAADFKRQAERAIEHIRRRGKTPIMVGGSGLYVDSVLFDYSFAAAGSARDTINPRHRDSGSAGTRQSLRKDALVVGLTVARPELRQRIEQRTEAMIEQGLISEVKNLKKKYSGSKALDAPGYKAFASLINGDCTLKEARDNFVANDLKLAKKQITWFRRNKNIHWFDNPESAIKFVYNRVVSQ